MSNLKSGGNPNTLAKTVHRRLFGKKKNQPTNLADQVQPKRTERLSVRLTADEKALLKSLSEESGISYTRLVSICLNALKKG